MKIYGSKQCDLCGKSGGYYFKSEKGSDTICPECYGHIFNKKLTNSNILYYEFFEYIKLNSLATTFKQNVNEVFAWFMAEREQKNNQSVVNIPVVRDENIESELIRLKDEINKKFSLSDYLNSMDVRYNRHNPVYSSSDIENACVELIKENYTNIRYLLLFGDVKTHTHAKYNELVRGNDRGTIQFNWSNHFGLDECRKIELYLVDLFFTNGINTVKYDLTSYIHKGSHDAIGNIDAHFHHIIWELADIIKKNNYSDTEWNDIYSKINPLYIKALKYIGGESMMYSHLVTIQNDFDRDNVKKLLPTVSSAINNHHIWHFSEPIMRHLITLGITESDADNIFRHSKEYHLSELLLLYTHDEFPVNIDTIISQMGRTYYIGRKPQSYIFQYGQAHYNNTESIINTIVNNGFFKKVSAETFQIFMYKLIDHRFYEVAREFIKYNNITQLDKKLIAKTKRELKS